MRYSEIIDKYFAGEYPKFSIKERAARIVSSLSAINFLVGAALAILLGLSINYIVYQIVFAFPFILIYYFLFKKIYSEQVIVILVISLSVTYVVGWFFMGGINGPGISAGLFIFYCNLQSSQRSFQIVTYN